MTNLPATLSTLSQQIGELTEKLTPATADAVAKSVRTMLAAGLALPSGMDADKAPEIYAYALDGVSGHGLNVATKKIIRGEYDINRGFVPTPPELAAMARAETRLLRADKTRLMEKRAAIQESASLPEKRDPAAIERIRQMRQEYREQAAARRAVGAAPQEPMTEEKAEYFRRIMSLRDAPDISAEQAAFRRKITKDVDSAAGDEREAAE